jgi:putative ABC transport system permease protein
VRGLRAFLLRLAGLFRRESWEADLDAELHSNLELHVDDNIRAGMSPGEARRAALLRFGRLTAAKDRYRDRKIISSFGDLFRDLRYSARLLWKDRLYSTTIVVTLTLCIGGAVTSFSALYGLVLKPLPFEHPERLVEVTTPIRGRGPQTSYWSWTQYRDYQQHANLFDGFAGMSPSTLVFDRGSEATRVDGQLVTADFFDLMGVQPLIGRFFAEEENVEGAHRVIVLPESVWRTDYLSDPGVIGQSIRVVGEPDYTIVGVAPRRLQVFDPAAKFLAPFRVQSRDADPQLRYSRSGQFSASTRWSPFERPEANEAGEIVDGTDRSG